MVKKKKKIDLREVFMKLQQQMISKLSTNRSVIKHPSTKGDASELNWIEMLRTYLPERYAVDKAFVLDCEGTISEQIDLVVYDRQYSPFLFNQDSAIYIPAESVYGVFEVKQNLNKDVLNYAGHKASSVRALKRTSVPITHAGGKFRPKKPFEIIAGILTLGSDWKHPLSSPLKSACGKLGGLEKINLGCCLKFGGFVLEYGATVKLEKSSEDDALIFFFVMLLEQLQKLGTAPAMDILEYARAIKEKKEKL